MATYIQGVQDSIEKVRPPQTNLQFEAQMLQTRQSKYDAGHKQLSDLYGKILNSGLTRETNVEARDDFFKLIDNDLRKVAGLDLSKESNVIKSQHVFEQIYDNDFLVKDMVWTRNYQDEMQRAEAFKNCVDPEKCGGEYWDEGIKYMQYKRQEFADSNNNDSLSFQNAEFVPYNNIMEKAMVAAETAGLSIKYDNVIGDYKVTFKNGDAIEQPLTMLFSKLYKERPQYQKQFEVESYVERKDAVASMVQSGEYATMQEAESGYIKQVAKERQATVSNIAVALKADNESIDGQIKDLQEKIDNNTMVIGSADHQRYENLQQLKQMSDAANEYAQSALKATDYRSIRNMGAQLDKYSALDKLDAEIKEIAGVLKHKDEEYLLEADEFAKMRVKFGYDTALKAQGIAGQIAVASHKARLKDEGKGNISKYQVVADAFNDTHKNSAGLTKEINTEADGKYDKLKTSNEALKKMGIDKESNQWKVAPKDSKDGKGVRSDQWNKWRKAVDDNAAIDLRKQQFIDWRKAEYTDMTNGTTTYRDMHTPGWEKQDIYKNKTSEQVIKTKNPKPKLEKYSEYQINMLKSINTSPEDKDYSYHGPAIGGGGGGGYYPNVPAGMGGNALPGQYNPTGTPQPQGTPQSQGTPTPQTQENAPSPRTRQPKLSEEESDAIKEDLLYIAENHPREGKRKSYQKFANDGWENIDPKDQKLIIEKYKQRKKETDDAQNKSGKSGDKHSNALVTRDALSYYQNPIALEMRQALDAKELNGRRSTQKEMTNGMVLLKQEAVAHYMDDFVEKENEHEGEAAEFKVLQKKVADLILRNGKFKDGEGLIYYGQKVPLNVKINKQDVSIHNLKASDLGLGSKSRGAIPLKEHINVNDRKLFIDQSEIDALTPEFIDKFLAKNKYAAAQIFNSMVKGKVSSKNGDYFANGGDYEKIKDKINIDQKNIQSYKNTDRQLRKQIVPSFEEILSKPYYEDVTTQEFVNSKSGNLKLEDVVTETKLFDLTAYDAEKLLDKDGHLTFKYYYDLDVQEGKTGPNRRHTHEDFAIIKRLYQKTRNQEISKYNKKKGRDWSFIPFSGSQFSKKLSIVNPLYREKENGEMVNVNENVPVHSYIERARAHSWKTTHASDPHKDDVQMFYIPNPGDKPEKLIGPKAERMLDVLKRFGPDNKVSHTFDLYGGGTTDSDSKAVYTEKPNQSRLSIIMGNGGELWIDIENDESNQMYIKSLGSNSNRTLYDNGLLYVNDKTDYSSDVMLKLEQLGGQGTAPSVIVDGTIQEFDANTNKGKGGFRTTDLQTYLMQQHNAHPEYRIMNWFAGDAETFAAELNGFLEDAVKKQWIDGNKIMGNIITK